MLGGRLDPLATDGDVDNDRILVRPGGRHKLVGSFAGLFIEGEDTVADSDTVDPSRSVLGGNLGVSAEAVDVAGL
jgi:hypothetical protein